MDKEKFCTCDEFCQRKDDCPYLVFCDTVNTIEQFLKDLRDDGKFCDGFNYMTKLVESDQQEAINIIARDCHWIWQNLQTNKKEVLIDHMDIWNETMEDPFTLPDWGTLRRKFVSHKELMEELIESFTTGIELFRLRVTLEE